MKPTKKQKNFAKKCGEYACNILLLNSFGRTWNWMEKDDVNVDGCNKAATIFCDLKYKELKIQIYPCFWEETENQQEERYVNGKMVESFWRIESHNGKYVGSLFLDDNQFSELKKKILGKVGDK